MQAFAGAHGVFLVTEAGFGNPEEEIQQGKNAVDAAKEVSNAGVCMAAVTPPLICSSLMCKLCMP